MEPLVILGAICALIAYGFAFHVTAVVLGEWLTAKRETKRQS